MNAVELSRAISTSSLSNSELLALNKVIIAKLNALRAVAVCAFVPGEKVTFHGKIRKLEGIVTGHTAKNIRVRVEKGDWGVPQNWTVAPSFLTKVA